MEEFFGDATIADLAEAHAEEVVKLSEAEMRRVLKEYKRIRQDLRDRLDVMNRGTFTAQQMAGTLTQIEVAIQAMTLALAGDMETATEHLADVGLDHLVKEIEKWDKHFRGAIVPVNLDNALIASDVSNFLFEKHQVSLSAYGESLRAFMAQELSNAVIGNLPAGEVNRRLGQIFLGEEWRLQRIVRTEMSNAYNVGKIRGMQETRDQFMPDLKKTLWHPMDSRTGKDSRKLAQDNPIVDVDEEFVEDSTGKTKRYMAPPNRPNDRAILIPYRESWAE